MKDTITISVLMSVYNEDFPIVKRSIDSLLNQDFLDYELILVDDGSTNDLQQELLQYAIKHENKITYLRHKNMGQSRSINKAILNAQGTYISILDADDEYETNHLSSCLKEMTRFDLIASTTKTIVNNVEDYYVPDKYDLNKLIHVDDCVLFATLFGKREVFISQEFKDTYAADAHFYESASKQFKVQKVDLRTYIYYRNRHTSVCSVIKSKNNLTVPV